MNYLDYLTLDKSEEEKKKKKEQEEKERQRKERIEKARLRQHMDREQLRLMMYQNRPQKIEIL